MPLHTDTLARLRRRTGTLLLLALASLALPAVARDLARIDSPGKVLSVVLEARHEGRLAYRLERNGETVIAPSPLGMLLGAPVSAAELFAGNLVPATLGNIVGGGLFVGGLYWYLNRK